MVQEQNLGPAVENKDWMRSMELGVLECLGTRST